MFSSPRVEISELNEVGAFENSHMVDNRGIRQKVLPNPNRT